MPVRFSVATLVALAAVAGPLAARAQDSQYWTRGYGARAQLLGGVVIGSDTDITAAYYNPGALGLQQKPQIIVTANAFEFSRLSLGNVEGSAKNLGSTSLSAVPSMVAGEVHFGFLGNAKLGYSVLQRQRFDVLGQIRDITDDSLIAGGTVASYNGSIRLEQHVSEYWGGLTYARPVSRHLGIGASTYVTVRNQRSREETIIQVLGNAGQGAIGYVNRDFAYANWRVLAKLGAQVDYPTWSAGVTLTTPSVRLLGGGQSGIDLSVVDQGVDGPPVPAQISTDFQDGLRADYRSPIAIGIGGSYRFAHSQLHVAAEWFGSVSDFIVLGPRPFIPQSGGDTLNTPVSQTLASVFNWGIGYEHRLTPHVSFSAGYRTDKTAASASAFTDATLSQWDLGHVAGGATVTIGRSDVVIGADVGFSTHAPREGINLLTGEGASLPVGATLSYVSATLFAGFRLAYH